MKTIHILIISSMMMITFTMSYLFFNNSSEPRIIISDTECCMITITYIHGKYEVRYDDFETNRSSIIFVNNQDDVDDLIQIHQEFCYHIHSY